MQEADLAVDANLAANGPGEVIKPNFTLVTAQLAEGESSRSAAGTSLSLHAEVSVRSVLAR